MRKQLAIILTIYIVLLSSYLVLGKSTNVWWGVLYFINNAFLIAGVLLTIRGLFETILINIVIGLSGVYAIYNVIVLIDNNFAEKINTCYWVCLIIVVVMVALLIRYKLKEIWHQQKKKNG
jgi:NADH:ubiquinone oxidoreductase subunit 6 (subunit J)